jgi:hypothetical protein
LAELATHNPDYLLVRQTDNALRVYKAALLSGAATERLPVINANDEFEPVPLKLSDATGYSESELTDRLVASGERRLESLKNRLQRSNELALAGTREAAQASENARYEIERDKLFDNGDSEFAAILGKGADQRLNLNVQIGALDKDRSPKNPVTAPDNYWDRLLGIRQDQLSRFDSQHLKELEVAQALHDAKLDELRRRIHTDTLATVATADEKLKARSAARVADYKRLMGERRGAILGAAHDFDQEMASALVVQAAKANASAAKSAPLAVNAAADANWKRRIVATMAYLTEQRSRQVSLVREETRRTVLDVAKQTNLQVVGWQSSMERHDLTPQVMKALRGRGWVE